MLIGLFIVQGCSNPKFDHENQSTNEGDEKSIDMDTVKEYIDTLKTCPNELCIDLQFKGYGSGLNCKELPKSEPIDVTFNLGKRHHEMMGYFDVEIKNLSSNFDITKINDTTFSFLIEGHTKGPIQYDIMFALKKNKAIKTSHEYYEYPMKANFFRNANLVER